MVRSTSALISQYRTFGTRFVDAFIQEMKKWTSGITDNPQAHVTNQVEKYSLKIRQENLSRTLFYTIFKTNFLSHKLLPL